MGIKKRVQSGKKGVHLGPAWGPKGTFCTDLFRPSLGVERDWASVYYCNGGLHVIISAVQVVVAGL